MKVFDARPVRGRWKAMESADDVLDLMDTTAEGVIALVRDAGATFLAPIFHELAGIVCTGGTLRSHIGIVSREFQVPCIMGLTFVDGVEPNDGDVVEIDCSGADGVLLRAEGAVSAPPAAGAPARQRAHVADLPVMPSGPGAAALVAVAPQPVGPDETEAVRAWINERIAYVAPIARGLTEERTALESKIIPVSAYIVTACIESFLRYPDMMRAISATMPASEIGRLARRPGCRVNTVYLWSVVNFWLIGRKVWEMVDPSSAHDLANARDVMRFWEDAALAFRGGDGTRHAADTATAAPYDDELVATLLAGVTAVADDETRAAIRSFNATLVAWLFLLYFDTRVGHGDTGPYVLPDGRVLLVRDFYELGESDFWWSDVARDVPYRNLTAAMVLDGVTVDRVTDFGTSYTTPEDFLEGLVGFGLYTSDGMQPGELRPVPLGEMPHIMATVRAAQAAHYRNIAAMSRDEKIRCGAYVYFSFLRPFAEIAGVADRLDWTVPRDIPDPIYQMVSMMEGDNGGVTDEGPYYSPIPG